ncbi:uncharacterized protein N7459_002409 [Penicillium hispanicum]|uniref:uncharacterized protein n=1 Tax=Penicillium hispanicum TaxID=1080232 RepID=UPI0025401F1A|nr:uncharacterized protein N7459_002409 [Penicillium hispanicum]KAJ5592040.1 hypothetical protein N7459_002409 [Penicillium hispanicum]
MAPRNRAGILTPKDSDSVSQGSPDEWDGQARSGLQDTWESHTAIYDSIMTTKKAVGLSTSSNIGLHSTPEDAEMKMKVLLEISRGLLDINKRVLEIVGANKKEKPATGKGRNGGPQRYPELTGLPGHSANEDADVTMKWEVKNHEVWDSFQSRDPTSFNDNSRGQDWNEQQSQTRWNDGNSRAQNWNEQQDQTGWNDGNSHAQNWNEEQGETDWNNDNSCAQDWNEGQGETDWNNDNSCTQDWNEEQSETDWDNANNSCHCHHVSVSGSKKGKRLHRAQNNESGWGSRNDRASQATLAQDEYNLVPAHIW